MEISAKRINNAINKAIEKGNLINYDFDFESDKDYVYICIKQHYIIRVPMSMFEVDIDRLKHTLNYRECKLENAISNIVTAEGKWRQIECIPKEVEALTDKLNVQNFYTENGTRISVNAKFFTDFYNKSIVKAQKIPENITFSAVATNSNKNPIIMYDNDDAVAMFLPIHRKD